MRLAMTDGSVGGFSVRSLIEPDQGRITYHPTSIPIGTFMPRYSRHTFLILMHSLGSHILKRSNFTSKPLHNTERVSMTWKLTGCNTQVSRAFSLIYYLLDTGMSLPA